VNHGRDAGATLSSCISALTAGVESRAFVGLHELAVNEDTVLLGPKSRQKKLSLLLDGDLVLLLRADRELVSLGELERKHAKVFYQRLTVDFDFQVADELIEREVDLVLLLDSNPKAELHW
jgi:hypothetical protein